MLKDLVRERLIAAADEIFMLFEKSYEEELCRKREENERQRRELEAVRKAHVVVLPDADIQLLISHQGQEFSPRLQGGTSSLEHPQPLHVREQEADVPMKSEEEPTESQRMMAETKGDRLFAPLSDSDDIGELLRSGTDSEEYAGSSRLEHPQPSHVKEEEEDSSSSNLLLSSPLVKCEDDDNSPDRLPLDHGAPTARVQSHAGTRTRKKRLSCSVCGHRFFRKIHLAAHMREHGGDNAASCCVCGQRFSSNVALIAHAATHTVDGPLVCPICAKRFSRKTNLSHHIHSHRQDSLRCSFCDKPFTQEGTMATHMRIHTTGKDFPCPLCGRRFCVEANMVWHMKTHKAF
ncbi:zinc finger and SCAN domain-containing protein 2-like isoform X2 [Syngnathus typhle]|uniref:zinc finger and SCAN domain-containing protein 2-like isoform X2 n=1 Tax=Syngnathus typhle TaxID=161592 RepID=UPI002A6AEFBA|nr:zinc finger and SCAN domain-containing protein 2-like isoform X2 [Syngnathus typhle]